MTKVPIVFIFNDNYTMPAGVCLSSLLYNAFPTTFYDVFVFYSSSRLSEENKNKIIALKNKFKNFEITFVDVKDRFKGYREVRHITVDAYCKFVIHEYLKDYNKAIYADVDMIFNGDLSELMSFDLNVSLGVARVPVGNIPEKYIKSINVEPKDYFNSGFMLMNLSKLRKEQTMENKLVPMIGTKFIHVDQDLLNITYSEDSVNIGDEYNFSLDKVSVVNIEKPVKVYHYAGIKPWNEPVGFGDIWWEYYRKSNFFSSSFYNSFQIKRYIENNRYMKIGKFMGKLGFIGLIKLKNKISKLVG